jgi:hypothetical protein
LIVPPPKPQLAGILGASWPGHVPGGRLPVGGYPYRRSMSRSTTDDTQLENLAMHSLPTHLATISPRLIPVI